VKAATSQDVENLAALEELDPAKTGEAGSDLVDLKNTDDHVAL